MEGKPYWDRLKGRVAFLVCSPPRSRDSTHRGVHFGLSVSYSSSANLIDQANMFSNSCSYGLQAVLYLCAREGPEAYTPIHAISDDLDISHSFLTKVLQRLNQKGIIQSYRGPNGGVALARAPEVLSLKDIVIAIDGEDLFTNCVLGLPGCGDAEPCPLHHQWEGVRGHIDALFGGLTVAKATEHIQAGGPGLEALKACGCDGLVVDS